jgi:putative two-component system response regulator
LEARIFAVADVWDALISDRPYRKALSEEDASQYMCERSGKLFDPEIIDIFMKMIGGSKQGDTP